ncbi:MAG TPA: nucleoside kinase [Bacilli bacterium]|nr:nucleoside kinase [Bacilli bacterium]
MSFKIKVNGTERTYEKKVKLLDLLDSVDENLVCARVNNRIRELTYEVYYDADVQFLSCKDQDSIRIYETSLRYLVAMAMERIHPELEIRFSYNVSRSIFMQILNKGIRADRALVDDLNKEMARLVDLDLPFERKVVPNDEAAKIYVDKGFEDKLSILKYRPEKTVHFYECDGYLNYMYGYMVPSTGYLKKFIIRQYSPGVIIQYPRSEMGGEIPPFEEMPTFGHTLKEAHNWAMTMGTDSVASINDYILNGSPIDFINMCEARHNHMLSELGDTISKDSDNIRLICIAGPSSSGKTTFANRLRIELMSRGLKPVRISIDDYYLPRDKAPLDEDGKPDLESIHALDIDLFNQNMLDLINGNSVTLPHFDFKIGKRVPGRTLQVGESEPIIIEGIHALNDQLTTLIPRHQKFKIYIAPQAQINLDNHNPISLTDLRLIRRLVRDFKFRSAPAELTLSMWPSVRKGEFTWIYKTQEDADYVYNSLLSYELPVMKKVALPLLRSIQDDSPYFTVAERLIRMLKYFADMDDTWVPCNSLMREFIGGSCYQDV